MLIVPRKSSNILNTIGVYVISFYRHILFSRFKKIWHFFIFSADNFRPYVTSFQGNNCTDYINAVFVDVSISRQNFFITNISFLYLEGIEALFYYKCLIPGLHSSTRIHCDRMASAKHVFWHLVTGLWSWLLSCCCSL